MVSPPPPEAYYGKPLERFMVAEAAMLAGLPKAPSSFNPFVNPKRAALRQQYVLRRMHELDYLNDANCWPLGGAADAQTTPADRPFRVPERDGSRQFVFDLVGKPPTRGFQSPPPSRLAIRRLPTRALRRGVLDYERRQAFRRPQEGLRRLPAPPKDGRETKESKEALAEAIETAFLAVSRTPMTC